MKECAGKRRKKDQKSIPLGIFSITLCLKFWNSNPPPPRTPIARLAKLYFKMSFKNG